MISWSATTGDLCAMPCRWRAGSVQHKHGTACLRTLDQVQLCSSTGTEVSVQNDERKRRELWISTPSAVCAKHGIRDPLRSKQGEI